MKIAYYITAHGYGHGARSCDIIRALRQNYPSLPVVVVSDLPADFLRARLPGEDVTFRKASFDVGMVQLDSIRVDVPATLQKVKRLYQRRTEFVASEADWIKREGVRAIASDIPAIPLEAAARVGIPRIALGNFAWDWIYEEFVERDPCWAEIVSAFREAYAQSDLLLRMPFAEPMAAFPRRQDIPLVATPGQARREELAQATGADIAKRWVLLSFTSLEWDTAALARVAKIRDTEFFTVKPLAWASPNIRPVDRHMIPFGDVVASCEAVVTKPGFGILSECVVNRKPIVYAERTDFREYPILETSIKKYLRNAHIPAELLYRGELREALAAVERAPDPPRRLSGGGDLIAAERLAASAS